MENEISPEEYAQFTQIVLDVAPDILELVDEEEIPQIYDEIKAKDPTITMEQLKQMAPQMAAAMREKFTQGPQEAQEANLSALNSISQGE